MADVGIKLYAEGEAAFKSALNDINSSLKVVGSELTLTTAQFDKNDESMESAQKQIKAYNDVMDKQKDKIKLIGDQLDNLDKSYNDGEITAKQYKDTHDKLTVELNKTKTSLEKNKIAVNDLGTSSEKTDNSVEKLSDELDKSAKTSKLADGAMSALSGTLKAASVAITATIAAAGAASVAVTKSLADMTVGAAAYADNILTWSTQTGMATDKLQEYSYAADLVDVSLDTLTGSMAKQLKSMSNARDGSAKYAAAYEKLGVSVANADGSLRDSDAVYWETIDALGTMTDETERDALAMQIFGKSAQELNPLIAQGSEGIKTLSQEARNAGAVMSGSALAAFGAYDDNMQKLTQGSNAAKNALGGVLLPQLTELSGVGVDLLKQFTAGLSGAGGDLTRMSGVFSNIFGTAITTISDILPEFVTVGFDIVKAIASAVMDNLDTIISAGSNLITSLVSSITSNIGEITNGALSIVMALADGIINNLPEIITAAVQCIVTLAQGIAESLPTLIPTVVDTILYIVDMLIDNIDLLIDGAIAIMVGLSEGLVTALPRLIERAPEIIFKLVDAFIENAPKIGAAAWDILQQLGESLIKAIPQLWDACKQVMAAIPDKFMEYIENIKNVGENIVEGLWQGITGAVDWIKEKVGGFAKSIGEWFKNPLEIHSPSKVFEGYGENIVQGLANGINAYGGIAYTAIRELANGIKSVYDDSISMFVTSFGGGNAYSTSDPTGWDAETIKNVEQNIREAKEKNDAWVRANASQIISDIESGVYDDNSDDGPAQKQMKAAFRAVYQQALNYVTSPYMTPQEAEQNKNDYLTRLNPSGNNSSLQKRSGISIIINAVEKSPYQVAQETRLAIEEAFA